MKISHICHLNNARPGYERNCKQVTKTAVDHICQLMQLCVQGDESPVIAPVATVELVSDPQAGDPTRIKFPCLATTPLSLEGDVRDTSSLHSDLFPAFNQYQV